MTDLGVQDTLDAFFRRDVVGGILPGVLVLYESWALIQGIRGADIGDATTQLWDAVTEVSLPGGFIVVLLLLASGWALGWIARKAGFTLLRARLVTRSAMMAGKLPQTTAEVLSALQEEDELLYLATAERHFWWPAVPSEVNDGRLNLFHRSKQWLLRNDPASAAAEKEATINALCGFAVAALGTMVFLFWLPLWFAMIPISAGWLLLVLAARERRYEEMDVLRNMLNSTTYALESRDAGSVPWSTFERLFGSGLVRSQLAWQSAAGLPVWLSVLNHVPGDWHTVWYKGSTTPAALTRHDDEGAQPLTVEEAAAEVGKSDLSEARAERIIRMAELYKADGKAELVVAAYRTPSGRTVLLDGNHRTVAAAIADVQTSIACFTVYGPASASLLPDLRHHK